MERYSIFLGRKNHYCENDHIVKCNLHIQCYSYQITNGIIHRTRIKIFTIHMETEKTPSSQNSLEKEEWSLRNQSSWLQNIWQSYSHQDSVVLAQRQKYWPMEQGRKPRNRLMNLLVHYCTLFLTEEARIYNGTETTSLLNGAGKIAQLHVREWNFLSSYTQR